jgi:shikimate kinase
MPASGKTTVGREVANRLGRPVIDIDEEIVKTVGCDIPQIFRERGEGAFRKLETEVLRQVLFSHSGCVISTGGGVPVREENREAMARAGRIFWLDRSLSLLCPTSDRPTASSYDAMKNRYEERYPIYQATADVRIFGDGSIDDVATAVIEEFLK